MPYKVSRVLGYMAAAVFAWWMCEQVALGVLLKYLLRSVALVAFVFWAWRRERPFASIDHP